MKTSKSIKLVFFCSLFLMIFYLAGPTSAKDVWKFGHVCPKGVTISGHGYVKDPYQVGAEKFKEVMEKETGGKIKIDVYPSGQLGSDREMLELLKLGELETMLTATAPLSVWEPTTMVFTLPFIFRDLNHARRVLDGPIGQEILDNLATHGMKGITYADNHFRHLVTRDKVVRSVGDMQGLKIRVMKSPVYIAMYKALGASATPVPYTEVYTALQTGVVDGYDIHPVYHLTSRHYEVAKCFHWTNHTFTAIPYLISAKVWNGLSPQTQKVVVKAMKAGAEAHRKQIDSLLDLSVRMLKKEGCIFIDLGLEGFAAKMGPVYEKFQGEIGGDLIERTKKSE